MAFKKGDWVRRIASPVAFQGMNTGDIDEVVNQSGNSLQLKRFGSGHAANNFVLELIMSISKTAQNMYTHTNENGGMCSPMHPSNFQDYSNQYAPGVINSLPNKHKTMIKKLSNFIKKTVDADTQEMLKANMLNGDLEPTCVGINELHAILWFANKDALVARAKEINTEAAAEEAKNK